MTRTWFRGALALALLTTATASAQTGAEGGYLLGQDKRLQIVVYVLGEVESPGEYIVPDDTDVLELISKAGGPTEFGDLDSVMLKRRPITLTAGFAAGRRRGEGGTVEKMDLDRFLTHENAPGPPILQPGDVVTVPRNRMHSWRTAFSIVRDVSVVVSTYLLYRRVVK